MALYPRIRSPISSLRTSTQRFGLRRQILEFVDVGTPSGALQFTIGDVAVREGAGAVRHYARLHWWDRLRRHRNRINITVSHLLSRKSKVATSRIRGG